jgi:hypothetical protein
MFGYEVLADRDIVTRTAGNSPVKAAKKFS